MGQGALRFSPLLCGLAANPALPADLLDRFIQFADADLRAELAERDDLSRPQVRVLAGCGGVDVAVRLAYRGLLRADDIDEPHLDVMLALLDQPGVPPQWVRTLSVHPDPSVRAGVASAPNVPADVLASLAGDETVDVVVEVALSAVLDPVLAAALARHPHTEVRRALALNAHTPPLILAALAADGGQPGARHCYVCQGRPDRDPFGACEGGHETAVLAIQGATVQNPATPAIALSGLVDRPDATVRWALAERQDLSQEAYHRLAEDPIPGVRGDVAANPAIDTALMWRMATDRAHDVRRRLAHNARIPLELLVQLATTTRIGPTLLPRIASATAEEVGALAVSRVAEVRMLLAQRPDLPATVVDALAADLDSKVVSSIAVNAMLTERQLRAMVDRHASRVVSRVARNPNCSPELLHHLAVHAGGMRKVYREIAGHPNATGPVLVLCLGDDRARPVAARHPALPVDVILELLDDPDVAEAAAANQSLPRAAMEDLLSGRRH